MPSVSAAARRGAATAGQRSDCPSLAAPAAGETRESRARQETGVSRQLSAKTFQVTPVSRRGVNPPVGGRRRRLGRTFRAGRGGRNRAGLNAA